MATIIDNATSHSWQLKDITYLTADDKKAIGIIGDVMLVDSSGNEITSFGGGAQYDESSIVDDTNVADGTYYPAATGVAFGGYRGFTLTGKIIDGAGETTTLTVEVTNDEDPATADWIQVYGYDTKNNAMVNSVSATAETKTFSWDFDGFNYRYVRFKIAASAATNTVIVKMRKTT